MCTCNVVSQGNLAQYQAFITQVKLESQSTPSHVTSSKRVRQSISMDVLLSPQDPERNCRTREDDPVLMLYLLLHKVQKPKQRKKGIVVGHARTVIEDSHYFGNVVSNQHGIFPHAAVPCKTLKLGCGGSSIDDARPVHPHKKGNSQTGQNSPGH